jgi:CRP-like cAMP-binding protein
MADLVLRRFHSRPVQPRIAAVVNALSLFAGLSGEQVARLAGVCGVARFQPGEIVFREGGTDRRMHIVLEGEVDVAVANRPVGVVRIGECLGEMSLLTGAPHSVTARARGGVETAVLENAEMGELIRLRPDIGLCIYRNLAIGAGEKLKRSNALLTASTL